MTNRDLIALGMVCLTILLTAVTCSAEEFICHDNGGFMWFVHCVGKDK